MTIKAQIEAELSQLRLLMQAAEAEGDFLGLKILQSRHQTLLANRIDLAKLQEMLKKHPTPAIGMSADGELQLSWNFEGSSTSFTLDIRELEVDWLYTDKDTGAVVGSE